LKKISHRADPDSLLDYGSEHPVSHRILRSPRTVSVLLGQASSFQTRRSSEGSKTLISLVYSKPYF